MQSSLEQLLDFLDNEPWLGVAGLVAVAGIVGGMLYMAFRSLQHAGQRQPPVIVVSLILGVVILIALVILAVRPSLGESLTVVIGSGIGSLGAAVVAAFEDRRKSRANGGLSVFAADDPDVEWVEVSPTDEQQPDALTEGQDDEWH